MKRAIPILVLLLLIPGSAVGEDDYAAYYGDGIRAYTESRYEDALEHLYRAFAARQNPFALKLIIRAHDFQGNCSARENAAAMLEDLFDGESIPPPQKCHRTGLLTLTCKPGVESARIDGEFDARCGSSTVVPVGVHRVESDGVSLQVEVRDNTSTVAALDVGRSYFGRPHRSRAARRDTPKSIFRQDLLEDPDMPASFRFRRD